MFSCCLQKTQGSGLKKDNSEGHGGVSRQWVRSCSQRLWPFGRKETNLTQGSQGQAHTDESRISADMVEKLVNHLVPSLQGGDPFFVPAFLYTYRRFATTQQVLDLLFKRYEYFCPYCEEDEQVKKTICTLLDTWMDKKPEEFCQTSALSIVKQMKNYLLVHTPYSDLVLRVHMLLTHLEEQEAAETEAKDEEVSDLGSHTSADPEH
ncbi:Ral guanine nucleotide dissociation stimulator [Lemmus lemmus]